MTTTGGFADTHLPTRRAAWVVVLMVLFTVVVAAAVSAADEGTISAAPSGVSEDDAVTPGTTTTSIPEGACRVTIVGGGAALLRTPTVASEQILSVPDGVYVVADAQSGGFGRRWLLIEVAGTGGWVRDGTSAVDAKTAECA